MHMHRHRSAAHCIASHRIASMIRIAWRKHGMAGQQDGLTGHVFCTVRRWAIVWLVLQRLSLQSLHGVEGRSLTGGIGGDGPRLSPLRKLEPSRVESREDDGGGERSACLNVAVCHFWLQRTHGSWSSWSWRTTVKHLQALSCSSSTTRLLILSLILDTAHEPWPAGSYVL